MPACVFFAMPVSFLSQIFDIYVRCTTDGDGDGDPGNDVVEKPKRSKGKTLLGIHTKDDAFLLQDF